MDNGLYIPELTSMSGNCLFESFMHIGLCDNPNEMRKSMAYVLSGLEHVELGNEFGRMGVLESTPEFAFEKSNDIKYVKCRKNILYKYSYQTMCRDMYGDRSWDRLHTEVILRVMAIVFNYGFRIFHDNGWINEIIPDSIEQPTIIHLGLMGEFHYVPIVPLPSDMTNLPKCPKFKDSAKSFHLWAKGMAFSLGKYIEDENGAESVMNIDDTFSLNQDIQTQTQNVGKNIEDNYKLMDVDVDVDGLMKF